MKLKSNNEKQLKKHKSRVFLTILTVVILLIFFSGCKNQTTTNLITKNQNNDKDCLTKDDFNIVKNYILRNGEQVKLYNAGIIADTSTMSMQLLFQNKTIAFVEYQNENKIIVIDKNNTVKIPAYFVSEKKNSHEISAYSSVFDTDKSIKIRKDNWCQIVEKIKQDKNNSLALIDQKTALKIAQKDALIAYNDLSIYNIKAELINNKWHVDYILADPYMVGGGPHYIISAKTGIILLKKYEQ